jgi:DnaJ-class molecular chaperone
VTHYQTLGVDPKASAKEVRDAFHKTANVHHPDSTPSVEAALAIGGIEWEEAQAAYEAIKTPDRRAAYDAKLLALAPKCSRCKGTKVVQKRTGWAVEDAPCPACGGTGKQV